MILDGVSPDISDSSNEQPAPFSVWAVVFGNYEPAEIDSLWASEAAAEAQRERVEASTGSQMWNVEEMVVGV